MILTPMAISAGLQSGGAEQSMRLAVATLPGDFVERWRWSWGYPLWGVKFGVWRPPKKMPKSVSRMVIDNDICLRFPIVLSCSIMFYLLWRGYMFVSAECSSLLDSRIYPCKGMKNYEQLPLRSSHLCRWVKETAPHVFIISSAEACINDAGPAFTNAWRAIKQRPGLGTWQWEKSSNRKIVEFTNTFFYVKG